MRRAGLFWGIILLIVGLALLLDNFGVFGSIQIWSILWPAGLILLGAWILWGALGGQRGSAEVETLALPLAGATQARVKIGHGAGRLVVNANAGPGQVVAGRFGGGVEPSVTREGDLLRVKLRMPEPTIFVPWVWGPEERTWEVGLTREVPLTLKLETGAGETLADLRELRVTELELSTGASSTELTLPAHAGQTRAQIHGGAASVVIHIPEGVAARIYYQGGVSSFNVDTVRFPRQDRYYQSPNYETAEHRVDLSVEMGVGSVEIR